MVAVQLTASAASKQQQQPVQQPCDRRNFLKQDATINQGKEQRANSNNRGCIVKTQCNTMQKSTAQQAVTMTTK